MRAFDFAQPNSVDEAIYLLGTNPATRILAGGTDLLVEMKFNRDQSPEKVISLKKLKALDFIQGDQGLTIGAMTTISSIEKSPLVRENFPALADAARSVGSVQVRNLGTIGGNIGRAAPSADLVPALIVYGAQVTVIGPLGRRKVDLESFFKGPGLTVLDKDEILIDINIKKDQQKTSSYLKLGKRKAMEIAVVGVAVALDLDGDVCRDCRIALGSVAPTVIRAEAAEKQLRGERISEKSIEAAAVEAMRTAKPITDIRATAEYRREMVGVMVRRAIAEAQQRGQ